ncbi:MAG: glycosyltransferase, partial [Candidatus Omnitrophica bacterium]|nr:glycosyltransferase [Candidatus Omnitrophota bacterium]
VALTQRERADLLRYAAVPERKITVIHTAVEPIQLPMDKPECEWLRRECGLPPEAKVVGMIARLEPIKGVGYFTQAAIQVSAVFPDAVFLIVGEGSQRPELEAAVRKENLQQRIIFLGWRENAARLIAIMDVLVLASLNEAVGLVLLEAQAGGIPVVATNVGGIPEVVLDGTTGIIVEPKNSVALALAITALLSDELKRKSMGEAGRRFVQDKYSAQDLVGKLSLIYEKLLA